MTLPNQLLINHIYEEMQHNAGSLSFARFMELALYTPHWGYYANQKNKWGPTGDFLTAPHMTPLFAECIAKQCHQVLQTVGGGDVLEIGAGSGVFAKDFLHAIAKQRTPLNHYFIFEKSAYLRQQQENYLKKNCAQWFSKIHWLDHLTDVQINGVIFANEVMDAIPFHCFQIKNNSPMERVVIWDENQFKWAIKPLSPPVHYYFNTFLKEFVFAEGYTSEMNVQLSDWVASIANCLHQGIILLLDYGYDRFEYYHPDRVTGTLMCYDAHHRHSNPFQNVGWQDMTAHVDFTTVLHSARQSHCALAGYTTQAAFLLALDILTPLESLEKIEAINQAQIIKKLLMPHEMGEAVKVIALSKLFDGSLNGFALYERNLE